MKKEKYKRLKFREEEKRMVWGVESSNNYCRKKGVIKKIRAKERKKILNKNKAIKKIKNQALVEAAPSILHLPLIQSKMKAILQIQSRIQDLLLFHLPHGLHLTLLLIAAALEEAEALEKRKENEMKI